MHSHSNEFFLGGAGGGGQACSWSRPSRERGCVSVLCFLKQWSRDVSILKGRTELLQCVSLPEDRQTRAPSFPGASVPESEGVSVRKASLQRDTYCGSLRRDGRRDWPSALPWCSQAGQPSVCHTHAYSLWLDFLTSLPPLQQILLFLEVISSC